KNGATVWVLLSVSLVWDAHDKPRYFIAQVQDITKSKRAEEELIEAKRFAESVCDHSTSIIYVFDLETMTNVYSNMGLAQLLGYDYEHIQALGRYFIPAITHPEDLPKLARHLKDLKTADDETVLDLELRVKNSLGEWRWLWARDVIFKRRADGSPRQVMGT